jgi:hypothetical protein
VDKESAVMTRKTRNRALPQPVRIDKGERAEKVNHLINFQEKKTKEIHQF